MDICKSKWQQSYLRNENFMFYPKEETVKFLNRFVRKRIAVDKFKDIMDFDAKQVKGLDFGCGIGRLTVLMKEFGLDAYGTDISPYAIKTARELALHFGYDDMEKKFFVTNGVKLPFSRGYFDVSMAESVLDSMPVVLAKKILKDIDRVTRSVCFISLISGDNSEHGREYSGEETVKTPHEKGTVQSYYNWNKIKSLIEGTNFTIAWAQLIATQSPLFCYKSSRYYLVLKKEDVNS